ncbi:response regulator [Frateuria aurantia]
MKSNMAAASVLVIDDDRIHRCYMAQTLLQLDRRPRMASTARHGLRLICRHIFEAVLLDYHLSDLDASAFIPQLHQLIDEPQACPPLIVMTAASTPARQRLLQRLGAYAVLAKPVRPGSLMDCLAGLDRPVLLPATRMAMRQPRPVSTRLRAMLQVELTELKRALAQDVPPPTPALLTRMHCLRASCSLCGAPSLACHLAAMECRLRRGQALSVSAWSGLREKLDTTMAALAHDTGQGDAPMDQ